MHVYLNFHKLLIISLLKFHFCTELKKIASFYDAVFSTNRNLTLQFWRHKPIEKPPNRFKSYKIGCCAAFTNYAIQIIDFYFALFPFFMNFAALEVARNSIKWI